MLDVEALAKASKALGLSYAACRLAIVARDFTAASGAERTTCRDLLTGLAAELVEPSGWLWGDTGLVLVSESAHLMTYEGLLFAAEIGTRSRSVHVRSLTGPTWRITDFTEQTDGAPDHLMETVEFLGASIRGMPDLADARARYRRYWRVARDDRSRPIAARLIGLR